MGNRGPTTITGDAARRGQRSESRASAALLSLAPPRPHQRPVGPRLHLRSRPDQPSRPSSRLAPAPSPTATSTWYAAAAKERADQLRDESKAAKAELEELQTWARDEAADRDRAEELRQKWAEWSEALEDDAVLARQVLGKALAGAPIYVRPGQEKRT